MFSFLTKILPWAKTVFTKIGSFSAKAEELEAEKELIEARAFAKGRISPKYLFQYFVVGAFGLLVVWMLAHAILPEYIGSPYIAAEKIFDLAAKTFKTMFEGL